MTPQRDSQNTDNSVPHGDASRRQPDNAAAAFRSTIAELTGEETYSMQDIDLVAPDGSSDEIPPPAYGDTQREVRDKKSGLGTRANITDDGRVDIRVNQLGRRLSQIFNPALRQQVQEVQQTEPPPPPYVPPSLGGDKIVPPPPSLNVVIQVEGSRGDVQPFVALGKVLKETYGHRVRLATHPVFRAFVLENGLEFFSIGADPANLMAFMVKNGVGLMPSFRSIRSGDVSQRRRDVAEYIQGCWRSCFKAGDGMADLEGSSAEARPFVADCIIANPPSFAHIHCAEKLGVPLHMMFTMPYSPTQAFPHPLANVQSNADPQVTNYFSYVMIEMLSWQGLHDIINRFRKKCLNLEPISSIWGPGMLHRLKIPHTYCWSPVLIPKPKDWAAHLSISGFFFLTSKGYTPSPDLQAFLKAGPPPVYIGFGSIVLDDPDSLTDLILEAARKTGQRVLLSKGWGGMGADHPRAPDNVFMLGNVPHDWLFQHVSCVVHHGGAGTTATGIAAGRPTAIVPFFGDQPFWGAMVARAGAGPKPIPYKQLTVERLVEAVNFCLRPETQDRAAEMASKIAAEHGSGCERGAQSFHQHLNVDSLRCMLAPSRPAVWRIRRTRVRLSAFAAATLVNAKLLDYDELKLFRAQEYSPDDGPSDPLSAFAFGVFRAFGGMATGVGEVPTETVRVFRGPGGSSRRRSSKTGLTAERESEASAHVGRSTSTVSPTTSRVETTSSKPHLGERRLSKLSKRSQPSSGDTESSPSIDVTRAAQREGTEKAHREAIPGRSKEYDMMRRWAHGSKGLGRVVTSALSAPMDISTNITKGFHNAPRLWGDDTVRPHAQVTDLKSGVQAVGKEFGYGMYDGLTGFVTQPWQGARKEGAAGFIKGVGKGTLGVVFKPGAALWGIPSHLMLGSVKEVQSWFGTDVQDYIVVSRRVQGYEEWMGSGEEEREEVVAQWELVRKLLKNRKSAGDGVQDVLEAHRRMRSEGGGDDGRGEWRRTVSSTHSVVSGCTLSVESLSAGQEEDRTAHQTDGPRSRASLEHSSSGSSMLSRRFSFSPDAREGNVETSATNPSAAHPASQKRVVEESTAQSSCNETHHATADGLAGVRGSEEESTTHNHTLRRTQNQISQPQTRTRGESSVSRPPSYDAGRLGGTTQSDFHHAQQRQMPAGEKTQEERSEEEVVMAYVRKQSLLEAEHRRNKGKGREVVDGEEDEELRRVIALSVRDQGGAV